MILEVEAALAEARVGVRRSDDRKSVYMGLDESGFWIRAVLKADGSRAGLFCLF